MLCADRSISCTGTRHGSSALENDGRKSGMEVRGDMVTLGEGSTSGVKKRRKIVMSSASDDAAVEVECVEREVVDVESALVEPALVEPALVDPVHFEPVDVELALVGPALVEPDHIASTASSTCSTCATCSACAAASACASTTESSSSSSSSTTSSHPLDISDERDPFLHLRERPPYALGPTHASEQSPMPVLLPAIAPDILERMNATERAEIRLYFTAVGVFACSLLKVAMAYYYPSLGKVEGITMAFYIVYCEAAIMAFKDILVAFPPEPPHMGDFADAWERAVAELRTPIPWVERAAMFGFMVLFYMVPIPVMRMSPSLAKTAVVVVSYTFMHHMVLSRGVYRNRLSLPLRLTVAYTVLLLSMAENFTLLLGGYEKHFCGLMVLTTLIANWENVYELYDILADMR